MVGVPAVRRSSPTSAPAGTWSMVAIIARRARSRRLVGRQVRADTDPTVVAYGCARSLISWSSHCASGWRRLLCRSSFFARTAAAGARLRASRFLRGLPPPGTRNLVEKIVRPTGKNRLRSRAIRRNKRLPNTHVPVVACRSAGIWTRGQSTAPGRPAAGSEPANPAQRGTRLEATTDRAFLVSAGNPKVDDQRGLSILPGVRTGLFLVQTMALSAGAESRSGASRPRRSI